MEIIYMEPAHWEGVKRIYEVGIQTGSATFEANPPDSWQEWSEKFLVSCSLVCLENSRVLGWAAVSRVSHRDVYRGVGEVSVYVSEEYKSQGIGFALLNELIHEAEDNGFWTLQAGIFPENITSLDLHQKLGFRIVGRREKIGKMIYGPYQGKWRDVLLLERRSARKEWK